MMLVYQCKISSRKIQLLVLPLHKAHGIYQGFEYDAIAIATLISNVLDISENAEEGILFVHPDGWTCCGKSNVLDISFYMEINELSESFEQDVPCDAPKSGWGKNYYPGLKNRKDINQDSFNAGIDSLGNVRL